MYYIRKRSFEHLSKLDISYFSNKNRGDLLSRMSNDTQELEYAITSVLARFITNPIKVIIYFSALFYISFELTLFTLFVVPLSGGFIGYLVKKMRKDASSVQQSLAELIGRIDEMLYGMRIIKAFNGRKQITRGFDEQNKVNTKYYLKLSLRREAAAPISETMSVSIVAGILFYGGSLVLSQEATLSASQFIVYIVLFSQVLSPIKDFLNAVAMMQKGIIAGNRLMEIFDIPIEINNKEGAKTMGNIKEAIHFKNVHFFL